MFVEGLMFGAKKMGEKMATRLEFIADEWDGWGKDRPTDDQMTARIVAKVCRILAMVIKETTAE